MAADKRAARDTLAKWQNYRGANPFAAADNRAPSDRCGELLGNATSLLWMLSAAADDAGTLLKKGGDSQFDNCAGTIMAGALDGIANLIDLAAFMMEGE